MDIECVYGVWKVRRSLLGSYTILITRRLNVSFVTVTTQLNRNLNGTGTSVTTAAKYLGGCNMKGYIKIEATTQEGKEGLRVKTELHGVDYLDRIVVVCGVCDALRISPAELKLMAALIDSDLMKALVDVNKLQDDCVEPQEAKKKPSNDLVDLLKSMLN